MEGFNHYFSDIHFVDVHPVKYEMHQIGAQIEIVRNTHNTWGEAEIIIIGCGDQRGANIPHTSYAPDKIREQLYSLYYWHTEVKIADVGNLIIGKDVEDTYHALATILAELHALGKKVILLGGSHDLTLAQYKAFQKNQSLINAVVIDSKIDLKEEERVSDKGFLMEMLTGKNNFVKHYTHLAFQSYFVNPAVIQTLDRLRFDCVRLGVVQENMDLVEPDLRGAHLLSIDMNAIRLSEAQYLIDGSPNGLFNNELCQLVKYASMNPGLQSIGFYGYNDDQDLNDAGAKSIAHAIWYLLDGVYAQRMESNITDTQNFEIHHVTMSGTDTVFLKSMRTGRWWMQLINQQYVPCSYQDYIIAANNEIPERWMRHHERIE